MLARPGPLVVGLEQLSRLPALDPAAPHGGQELHEAEVGNEPPVVAAEALEEDDADRPRSETALAREAIGCGVARHVA